jgi:hypothetical protein
VHFRPLDVAKISKWTKRGVVEMTEGSKEIRYKPLWQRLYGRRRAGGGVVGERSEGKSEEEKW